MNKFRARHIAAVASAFCASATLQAQENQAAGTDVKLDTIVVSGSQTPAAAAKADAQAVPGAAAVIDNADVERGRAANLEDILAFQPGVFAQATGGTGAAKISIRGSGIQTSPGYFREGIKFLYDGIPITGPGGTPDEMLNAAGVNYTEVLYGGNALKYTALSLGGAINFQTHTGYTAPGLRVGLQAGSYDNRKWQASYGGVSGDVDYFVQLQQDWRHGFQHGSNGKGNDGVVNIGWKITSRLDSRLTVRHREEQYIDGSTLTLEALRKDPETQRVNSGRRKPGSTLVGLTTGYNFDDESRLELALGYHHFPHTNGWGSTLPAEWNGVDLSTTLRYIRANDTLFGKKSKTTLTFSDTYQDKGETRTYDRTQSGGPLVNFVRYDGSRDSVLSGTNDLRLAEGPHETWLTTGLAYTRVRRNVRVPFSASANTTPFGKAIDRTDTAVAPRIGLRFQATPELQVVGNVTRSVDPSSSWGLAGSSAVYVRNLQPQKATTFELGLRGNTEWLDGSLTFYRSNVSNELLTIVLAQATATTTAVVVKANAGKTVHQGVEAGLTAKLWKNTEGSSVVLRQALTVSDFHYDKDATFGSNQLPGLPRRAYQAELQYQDASGFYAGLNVRSASSYFVDYANSLKAPSYAILGARVGYEAPSQKYKFYVDFRNLGDKHYVSATSPSYNLGGVDSAVFYPGEGRSVFAGVTFRY
ncbi:TonB-dependent receptor family protein [Xylophilus sp.]|uniref:TonB-dependent receptor family protein n=1 Tax=Xylophilus sp. TaxID=2653893 RepID=UPI002D7F3B48|nr:TonB-dependent receptor [Xylophilus sp.]